VFVSDDVFSVTVGAVYVLANDAAVMLSVRAVATRNVVRFFMLSSFELKEAGS
jgi:hypothetical protein